MLCKLKYISMMIVGFTLIIHSLLVWFLHYGGPISILDDGTSAIFITANVSDFGIVINILLFLLGDLALLATISAIKKKSSQNN